MSEHYTNYMRNGANIIEKSILKGNGYSYHDEENKCAGGDASPIKQNGYGRDPIKGDGK